MKLKLCQTYIEVSFTLICAVAVCVISELYKSLIYCISAVIIHEAGHLAAMRLTGKFPERIKISLFEIDISDSQRHTRSERENALIIFFGPAANFICFIVCYLLYLNGSEIFGRFAPANLSVGCFNSLPVITLDGGQLLHILLCKKLSADKAGKIIDILTAAVLVPLAAAGFVVLFQSKYNFSLLFVCGYLILSLIMRNKSYY